MSLQEFLKKEFSDENIVFWIACENFRSITDFEEVCKKVTLRKLISKRDTITVVEIFHLKDCSYSYTNFIFFSLLISLSLFNLF